MRREGVSDVRSSPTHVSIAIVGAGFSGIGAAIRLKQAGFHDFVVLERAAQVGGVWRDNSYPGAACDVESHLYSFSFAPNPRWSHTFSRQPEILDYLQRCVRDFQLLPHLRFDHAVSETAWSEQNQHWKLETAAGPFTADVMIMSIGGLSEPAIPDLPGLAKFEGKVFHSARWEHGYDLAGKTVAVIGTGASAIQFVPEIQPTVKQLKLFQRTPAWVIPRMDHPISALEQRAFAKLPALQKLSRLGIYVRRELFVLGFRNPRVMQGLELLARLYLRRSVPDPVLREKLTPNFRIGCKRILISSDYLPALTQSNVDVVTDGIREVRERTIVTRDGVEHSVDAIIFGTGFHVTDIPFAHHVRGRAGATLHERWQGSPEAHRGTTVAGFPNLFLLLGPNTGLGHTSVIHMLESQLQIVIAGLRHLRDKKLQVFDAKPEAQARFTERLQNKMRGTVWTSGGCASWYLDEHGRNSTLWPTYTFSYRREARFIPSEYALEKRSAPTQQGRPVAASRVVAAE
jgi:cation diffusion facilitator CzcD-associated flavoprotein CzcO